MTHQEGGRESAVAKESGGFGGWNISWYVYWYIGVAYVVGVAASREMLQDLTGGPKWLLTVMLLALVPAAHLLLVRRRAQSHLPSQHRVAGDGEDAGSAAEGAADGPPLSKGMAHTVVGVVAVVFFLAVLWSDEEFDYLVLYQLLVSVVMLSMIVIAVEHLKYARKQLREAEQQNRKIEEQNSKIGDLTNTLTGMDRSLAELDAKGVVSLQRSLSRLHQSTKWMLFVLLGVFVALTLLVLQRFGVIPISSG